MILCDANLLLGLLYGKLVSDFAMAA